MLNRAVSIPLNIDKTQNMIFKTPTQNTYQTTQLKRYDDVAIYNIHGKFKYAEHINQVKCNMCKHL